jgi:hypothetical protein
MRDECGVEAASLYMLQSKCNHCCEWNADSISYTLPDSTIELVAARDILAGNQVFITYVDPSKGPADRRRKLKGTHGFECACARCQGGQHFDRKQGEWVQEENWGRHGEGECRKVKARGGEREEEELWEWGEGQDESVLDFLDAFEVGD